MPPLTVHTAGVDVVNVTGRPLDEVAAAITGVCASVLPLIPGNVIVLASFDTVKLRLTDGAALYAAVPG